ncbi:hypothetical protein EDC01DRAFT_645798 [Geopyxis carbonaria]|nr:hypothetical protein EDC01DRAFT_645798 [Geopyxis carbonaria]
MSASKLGSPCWVGIPAVDIAACKTFYSSLFPSWRFFGPEPAADDPQGLALFSYKNGPSEMSGGIIRVAAEAKAVPQNDGVGMCLFHYVESIDEIHGKILELGGKLVLPKSPEGEAGFYAKYRDTEGNIFGICEEKS